MIQTQIAVLYLQGFNKHALIFKISCCMRRFACWIFSILHPCSTWPELELSLSISAAPVAPPAPGASSAMITKCCVVTLFKTQV